MVHIGGDTILGVIFCPQLTSCNFYCALSMKTVMSFTDSRGRGKVLTFQWQLSQVCVANSNPPQSMFWLQIIQIFTIYEIYSPLSKSHRVLSHSGMGLMQDLII